MIMREFLAILVLTGACSCSEKDRPTDQSTDQSAEGMYCFELPKIVISGSPQIRKPHSKSKDLLVARGGVHFYDHEKKTLGLEHLTLRPGAL